MKINKTYRSLLDKSIGSMLSAIELYNKPDFKYREETFAILSVNSWELLFKAHLLKISNYKIASLYEMEVVYKKNGQPSKRKKAKENRSGNALTISISETIKRLRINKVIVPENLIKSIDSLIELRDNAIHFHNSDPITKHVQELGFACIKNYMSIIKKWNIDIDLSIYNFYLMPLAYVNSKVNAKSVITDEISNYLSFLKNQVREIDSNDVEFDVAISVDINLKKSNNFSDSLLVKYDENGAPIYLTEENILEKYPLSHKDVITKAKYKYSDFKQNDKFHNLMKEIKKNESICFTRKLDPNSKSSQKKDFYSGNIFQILDQHYKK